MAVDVSGDPLSVPVIKGAVLFNRDVALKAAERVSEVFTIAPKDVGLHTYTVRVTGPNGIDVARELTFDVKPPSQDIKRTTVSSIAGNGGTLTLGKDLVRGMITVRQRSM